MQGIVDISAALVQITQYLYELYHDDSYKPEHIEVINTLRSKWMRIFNCNEDKIPDELQFTVVDGKKKPKLVIKKFSNQLTISDFHGLADDMADNELGGLGHTGAQVILRYFNTRKARYTGAGTDWDPTAQFCHLILSFYIVLSKVNLDDHNTLNSLENWLQFINEVVNDSLFPQGQHGRMPLLRDDVSTSTFATTLTEVSIVLEEMIEITSSLQKRKSARDHLKLLNANIKNASYWIFNFTAKIISPTVVEQVLTVDTIGNCSMRQRILPNYGINPLEKYVLILGERLQRQLRSKAIGAAAEPLLTQPNASSLWNVERGGLDKSIYSAFITSQEEFSLYQTLGIYLEAFAKSTQLIETAIKLSGDGGDALVYHVLGNTLPNVINMSNLLHAKINNNIKMLYKLANNHAKILRLKPDHERRSIDKAWLENFSQLTREVMPEIKRNLKNLNTNAEFIIKDFHSWQDDAAGKIEALDQTCLSFVIDVNSLGSEIENLGIGYEHRLKIDPAKLQVYVDNLHPKKLVTGAVPIVQQANNTLLFAEYVYLENEFSMEGSTLKFSANFTQRICERIQEGIVIPLGVDVGQRLTSITQNCFHQKHSIDANLGQQARISKLSSIMSGTISVEAGHSQIVWQLLHESISTYDDQLQEMLKREPGLFSFREKTILDRHLYRSIRLNACKSLCNLCESILSNPKLILPQADRRKLVDLVTQVLDKQKLNFAWGKGERNLLNREIGNLQLNIRNILNVAPIPAHREIIGRLRDNPQLIHVDKYEMILIDTLALPKAPSTQLSQEPNSIKREASLLVEYLKHVLSPAQNSILQKLVLSRKSHIFQVKKHQPFAEVAKQIEPEIAEQIYSEVIRPLTLRAKQIYDACQEQEIANDENPLHGYLMSMMGRFAEITTNDAAQIEVEDKINFIINVVGTKHHRDNWHQLSNRMALPAVTGANTVVPIYEPRLVQAM